MVNLKVRDHLGDRGLRTDDNIKMNVTHTPIQLLLYVSGLE